MQQIDQAVAMRAVWNPAWLEAQFNARAAVPEHPAIFRRWAADSARARERLRCLLDVPYGATAAERLDVYLPVVTDTTASATRATTPTARMPIVVFIHGGYWRSLDKAEHGFVAPTFVDAGAMVVVPNYGLCPAVGLETIALQMARALAWVHREAPALGGDVSRLVVVGHSAGGHLAAMLLACDGRRVATDLPERLVRRAVTISGLFELAPLQHTPFIKDDLRLTPRLLRRVSPARFAAPDGARLHAWVGADESAAFKRQNELIRERWGADVVPVCATIPGRHHIGAVDDLADGDGLTRRSVVALWSAD